MIAGSKVSTINIHQEEGGCVNIYLITLFSLPSCPITLWWMHEIIIIVLTIATSHSAEMGTYQIVMVENVNARGSAKTLAACNAYVWHLKHLICKFGCHIVQTVCHTVLYAEMAAGSLFTLYLPHCLICRMATDSVFTLYLPHEYTI